MKNCVECSKFELVEKMESTGNGVGKTIMINLRGQRFEVVKSTLANIADTRLARLNESSAAYNSAKDEYYFDVNPRYFHSILDAYSMEQVHFAKHACLGEIQKQLCFWGLDESVLAPCCYNRYKQSLERDDVMLSIERQNRQKEDEWKLHFTALNATRRKVYKFLELPNSSRAAKVWSIVIMVLVVASVILLMLETVQSCRIFFYKEFEEKYAEKTNGKLLYLLTHSRAKTGLLVPDFIITFTLTLELTARFAVSPFKKVFFSHKYIMNVIDLLGVAPLWIIAIVLGVAANFDGDLFKNDSFRITLYVFSCVKIVRVFRLFKLMNHYKELKLIHLAVYHSRGALLLLLILLALVASVFANFAFIAEIAEDNFHSAFHSMWWAIITMTTVGYGDVHPVGPVGYCVGSVCAIMGILVIALPVPVVVNNFSNIYDCSQTLNRLEKRRLNKIDAQNTEMKS